MGSPRIFYFCYDHQKPSGGQRKAYRHIDILNEHGYEAFAFHIQNDFRLSWFENDTKVIHLDAFKRMYDPIKDFISLPEDLGEKILSFPGKKVIFNQGVYLGFYCLGLEKFHAYPYLHPDIKAVLVVSEHNKAYLNFAYPDIKIHRVYNAVQPDKFIYQPLKDKKKVITSLPSKNLLDLSQIYHILMSRAEQGLNNLKEYQWIFIDKKREEEVIGIFRDSFLFLFLSTEEGFGLMPLEAMLSGSLIAAYDAGPLSEFLCNKTAILSQKGDIISLVKSIEEITKSFHQNGEKLQAMSEAALDIALRYSLQREKESVLSAWKEIIEETG